MLAFTSTLDLPDEYRTKVLAGWHYHLDALAGALEGRATDLVELPGWEALHERYLRGMRHMGCAIGFRVRHGHHGETVTLNGYVGSNRSERASGSSRTARRNTGAN